MKRIIMAFIIAIIVVLIGIITERQKFADPLEIVILIALTGQACAVLSFYALRKKYNWYDSFWIATAISIFSCFPGLIVGLIEFSLETGNLGRSIFHTIELSLVVVAVVYLIIDIKPENSRDLINSNLSGG